LEVQLGGQDELRNYGDAGWGIPGELGKGGGTERKLRHKLKGNRPSKMIIAWLPIKSLSQIKAASIKP
jgi:hypothetical protein